MILHGDASAWRCVWFNMVYPDLVMYLSVDVSVPSCWRNNYGVVLVLQAEAILEDPPNHVNCPKPFYRERLGSFISNM